MAEKYKDHIKFVKVFRQDNRELAQQIEVTGSPTVLFFQNGKEVGHRLTGYMTKPQVRLAIEEILGNVLPPVKMERVDCDVLILGAGPSGLSAGVYAGRAKLNTVILEEGGCGGQVATTCHVANYPGTQGVVDGKALAETFRKQALSFGARIDDFKEIFEVNLSNPVKYVRTEDAEYYAKTIILATGARPRDLPAIGADEFKGKGVHYCATCDGAMYEDAYVAVLGGGSAAIEEAVYLTRFATHVTIIHRREGFRAAQIELEEAQKNEKISFLLNKTVKEVKGGAHSLTEMVLEDVQSGETMNFRLDGAFVYIGNDPQTKLFKDQVELDETGYIVAGEDTLTNLPGVFAAGDVRTKQIRQIATATSDGVVAAIMAEKFITAFQA
jgi:thioredoxin reductase (NADPH)